MPGAEATILVVDDKPGIRFFLEEVLSGDGYQVVAAASGEEALEHIEMQRFDAAVIDLIMKEVDGMAVLAALKRCSPDTAAIVLTAHGSLETAVEALRQGAHDYLLKPCKTSQLREALRAALTRSRRDERRLEVISELERLLTRSLRELWHSEGTLPEASRPPLPGIEREPERFLQRGDLTVDFARHLVELDGRELKLSPTEYGVLAYLAKEAPRVVSAEEVACEVQGHEEPWKAADTVRYHIYRIRHKIRERTGRGDIIHTVRGVGYTMGDVDR